MILRCPKVVILRLIDASLARGLCDQLRGGALREKAQKFGLDTDDFGDMVMAWEEWATRDDATLAALHGEILVQK